MSVTLSSALTVAAALAWLALLARITLVTARMFQIEEYEGRRLFAWGSSRAWLLHRSVLVAVVPPVVGGVVAAASTSSSSSRGAVAAGWLLGASAAQAVWAWLPPKKELVQTPRLRRLLLTAGVLACLVAAGVAVGVTVLPPAVAAIPVAAVALVTTVLSMVLLVSANEVNRPLEAQVRRGFLRRARRRLGEVKPLVIAVAGSYGKTSTKHILAHLLEQYGSTLATPKSFNTLMGVCRTVNDVLEDGHRTFIVEMDAYAPGEIAAICDLVRPRHALLTSLGPQHLERFGTLQRIGDALYESIEALPEDGFAVIYAGDAATAALAERARQTGRVVISYGIAGEAEALDVVADSVRITATGSRFTWRWDAEGLRHDLVLPLLGRHQALNVSAALAAVHQLGLPLGPALAALSSLRPVDHRLQPVATGNAITVIDDSYNANPVGVHNGLEVLAELDARQRILVTPGLVELGEVEDDENRRYGEHAARVCDHVIVVDARPGRAFQEGLRAAGLDESRIHVVRSLADATAVIGQVAAAGDAVLFANDLPDTYLGAA